jgi:hypothetical protein
MRCLAAITCLILIGTGAFAQEPPQLLPSSITGSNPALAPTITPASGTLTPSSIPIARFDDVRQFPPETLGILQGAKAGANWIWRMNQSTGRFLPGLNPTTRTGLTPAGEYPQALATLALVEAARFTGEDRFRVRASQAVLTMLTLTEPDPADSTRRQPKMETQRGEFAAALALAIYQLPDLDENLAGQAEELVRFLDHHLPTLDRADTTTAGMVIECLALSHRQKPADWKRDRLAKHLASEFSRFEKTPDPLRVAAILPGSVDFVTQAKPLDATQTTHIFTMADWLSDRQITRSDAKNPIWIGGFRTTMEPPGTEPTEASATSARALAAAAHLTRQVPDLVRFQNYREACVGGLVFVSSLQFTDRTAEQFEPNFRQRYMIGGVHHSPTNGTLRLEATAGATRAYLTFLQSGAESRGN